MIKSFSVFIFISLIFNYYNYNLYHLLKKKITNCLNFYFLITKMELYNHRSKILFFAFLIGFFLKLYIRNPNPTDEVKGFQIDKLSKVRPLFKKLLYTEREGASIAVYHKNNLVLHLYGGYADKESNREWEEDTHTVVFSLSKAVTSMIISHLVSKNLITYDTKISSIWKEFGLHHKSNATLRHVLDHEVGLITFGAHLTLDDLMDDNKISKIIEEAKPLWPVGSTTAYHALTRGFILNQIVKRIVGKSIGRYLKDNIISKIQYPEFYISLPEKVNQHVARISNPHVIESIYEWALHPLTFLKLVYNFFKYNKVSDIASNYPEPLAIMKNYVPYNNPKIYKLEVPSANGIGTSRGLSSLLSYFITSDLITPEVKKMIERPLKYVDDKVLVNKIYRGYGFTYDIHPLNSNKYIMSFVGNGMQVLDVDLNNEIVICLLRNGLRPGLQGHSQYIGIRHEIFKSLSNNL
ncbi:Beta-lactamase-related domain and Beta-lactamase/transpeptidase-like domain-containing protein [Strongyloides ratti]|uniref:Beta-lactamase-related domain and Beta-lactamase/transpeptidase-like domain-containing protein n=1 Tax=Strongyloides ratti TaxID=34506 RepID=A0A090KVE1_STRRB|nr:Beta-lactamase-related domain and Beta-lactamase/transpeptidase-like domain-containing protein [Strongyloides ratti]CEF59830.1 Beta-lactamase-related domain and Beta-lactamase/transpeptidase-like domain-containing protein [Strongyloides ratti]